MFFNKSVHVSRMITRTAYFAKIIIVYFIALVVQNESFQLLKT